MLYVPGMAPLYLESNILKFAGGCKDMIIKLVKPVSPETIGIFDKPQAGLP
jgi:hypothetical protein